MYSQVTIAKYVKLRILSSHRHMRARSLLLEWIVKRQVSVLIIWLVQMLAMIINSYYKIIQVVLFMLLSISCNRYFPQ